MQLIPISTQRVELNPEEELIQWIKSSLDSNQKNLQSGDILIISSKIVSYFERQIVELVSVPVSSQAFNLAKQLNADPHLMQLALNQADELIAPTPWVLLTKKNGIYCANAGVDTSNVQSGYAVVWPRQPFLSAYNLRDNLQQRYNLSRFSVIIADSMCLPGRSGTLAITIGYSGIQGLHSLKGTQDLFANTLRYSALNVVDSLATAANLLMGEGAECVPLVIVRNYNWQSVATANLQEMLIGIEDEMFPLVKSSCSLL